MLQHIHDTIIAMATPPGVGAIGVLRLSGKDAIVIADKLFPHKDLTVAKTHTLHVGWLMHNGVPLDEVVVSIFKGPRSYTGENVVEISCHGSVFIQQKVMDACVELGARVAKPGEYTQRAFLNGKLDLTQAEAVADVIASNTEASHQASLNQMRGGFSSILKQLREELIKFSALIELELDFAMEDVEFADRTQLQNLLLTLHATTKQLIDSFRLGNVIKNGVEVAIIGKPNAGKSTLLNALLNENRAIVSDIAGTTRDTVEEVLNINGILFRLVDTAGIRQSDDAIESIGVEKSFEKMRQANLVIYLFDALTETREELADAIAMLQKDKKQFLLVANKMDTIYQPINEKMRRDDIISISARNKEAIERLENAMVTAVTNGDVNTESTLVTNARHLSALNEVMKSLNDIQAGINNQIASDFIALDIRRCLHYLGEITGTITNEDQLDFIFSKFCIGK